MSTVSTAELESREKQRTVRSSATGGFNWLPGPGDDRHI